MVTHVFIGLGAGSLNSIHSFDRYQDAPEWATAGVEWKKQSN